FTLRGNYDYLGRRSVVKRVVGQNFHSAAGTHGFVGFSYCVELRSVVHVLQAAGREADILEYFPWPAGVDDYCSTRKQEGDGNAAFGGSFEWRGFGLLRRGSCIGR